MRFGVPTGAQRWRARSCTLDVSAHWRECELIRAERPGATWSADVIAWSEDGELARAERLSFRFDSALVLKAERVAMSDEGALKLTGVTLTWGQSAAPALRAERLELFADAEAVWIALDWSKESALVATAERAEWHGKETGQEEGAWEVLELDYAPWIIEDASWPGARAPARRHAGAARAAAQGDLARA